MRLIDSCITQQQAQGPSKNCTESREEATRRRVCRVSKVGFIRVGRIGSMVQCLMFVVVDLGLRIEGRGLRVES